MTAPASQAPTATLPLLLEFYIEKLADLTRHQSHATIVRQYDANNTYQYIINREEVQLSWLSTAITDAGGTLPEVPSSPTRGATSARALCAMRSRTCSGSQHTEKPPVYPSAFLSETGDVTLACAPPTGGVMGDVLRPASHMRVFSM